MTLAAGKIRFLHVANGTCTTRLIEAAGIPGALSIWADPLYEGPVPGGLTDTELLDVRRRYLGGPTDIDAVNDLREWRATIERHESYDELILWFEHDLFDQLNLIQLLTWIREHVPATKPASLVCIGSFPGHPGFKGLGELTPDELASLVETRHRVGDEEDTLAKVAWQAFGEQTPEPLDHLRQGDTSAMPYLAAAVTRFLQEYPWTVDGLSRTERRLLELAGGGGITLAKAFRKMHEGEDAYYITDISLSALAAALSRTSPALLMFALESAENDEVLPGAVRLTDTGRDVLAGQLDRVSCGLDRWLGECICRVAARCGDGMTCVNASHRCEPEAYSHRDDSGPGHGAAADRCHQRSFLQGIRPAHRAGRTDGVPACGAQASRHRGGSAEHLHQRQLRPVAVGFSADGGDFVLRESSPGRVVSRRLRPKAADYFVLKPKHSGFFDTTLDTLLDTLRIRRVILTGIAGNICVLFTANDAYMRELKLFVPSDCIVSNTAADNNHALRQIETVLKGNLTPSTQLRFRGGRALTRRNRVTRARVRARPGLK